MPFKSSSDPSLPANIKKLATAKRSKFVSTFNNAFSSCQRDGGKDCEGTAFRIANASVKESNQMNISDFMPLEILESSFDDKTGKKELLVTLLKEGPGNKFHNNYYTKSSLASAAREVMSKPKQYFNHAKDIDNPDRDIRDWGSSITEAWVDNVSESGTAGKSVLKARVKVYDNWLWERAKAAPQELALSIEGKGHGREEMLEGKPYNAIYEIQRVNGVNWVDYPGNAGMGVQILEKENIKATENEEEKTMLQEVLEGLKGLTQDELKEVAISKPELKEFFILPPVEDKETKQELASLKESLGVLGKTVESLQKEKTELANKVESHEIKDKARDKEKLVESMLSSSKLKDDHKTDTFRESLMKCDKEDEMKKLIDDREKICVVEVADPGQKGAGAGGNEISEKDKAKGFVMNMFGEDISDDDIKQAVNL